MGRCPQICLTVCLALVLWPAETRAQVGFAEDQADRVSVFNSGYYEVAFRKTDGRILFLFDKTTQQEVSPGNIFGPWVIRFADGAWLDGANFSPSNPARTFSYVWDDQAQTLTFYYTATGAQACQIVIEIRPTPGAELDSTLTITNNSQSNIELLAYPVNLTFRRDQIDGVYVPYMEGMKLLPGFFAGYEFGSRYPGQMFADFSYTDLSVGAFAVYFVHDLQSPIIPGDWLLLRDDAFAGGVHKYHHDFTLNVAPGQQWSTPTMVISIGASLDEAMAAYWTRNGHDQMPSLLDKLGDSLFQKLSAALLLKHDFLQGSWTFASFQSFAQTLPANNLLHLVAFWPNGFDENYPDYLPPNPALGGQSDFESMVSALRSSGHLVMPYTNPTWWDDQSPTLASLGTQIVATDRNGDLISETYGQTHHGYVVSPHAAQVIARQDQTRDEFTNTVACDLLFEDQIGARAAPKYDGHPQAPDPTQYTQGLVDVAQRSATWLPIMTEGGFDRLAWFESGFCNSHTIGWHGWPSSTYESYPMAPLWAHENLYFSAHNLAGSVMTVDLKMLTYYVSMGYALSYDLATPDMDWLNVIDQYQKHFVSRLMGTRMTAFEILSPSGHNRTDFEDGTQITANLTPTLRTLDNHVIAADGFVAIANGQVQAGVLTTLNGQLLSGSLPHYLIFEREAFRIRIHQPRGDDGVVSILRPSGWIDDDRIHLAAFDALGQSVAQPIIIQPATLAFDYLGVVSATDVEYFEAIYCTRTDFDCDGDTDLADYGGLADCLAGPNTDPSPAPPGTIDDCLSAFDADTDMDVDLWDHAAFLAQFQLDD